MPASQRVSTLLTYALALFSCLTFEVVLGEPERATWLSWVIGIAKMVLALSTGWLLSPLMKSWMAVERSRDHSLPMIGGIVVGILSTELLIRAQIGLWLPFELLLLLTLQAVILALVIVSFTGEVRSLTAVMATFLVIFSAALGKPWWLQLFVLGYLAAGIWWLMGRHWESLNSHLVSSSASRFPRRWLLITPMLLLIAMMAIPLGYSSTMGSLPGFMPSSGGHGDSSPWARGGVNDGDAVIAGTENVKSFAPIDDAPFMTSHDPSLYDLFDDTYSEPIIPKNQDRAIALPRQFRSTAEQRMAKAQTGGRPFSTLRRPEQEQKQLPSNIATDALAFVVGRVPLHLSLQTFAEFDGVVWQAEGEPLTPSMHGAMETVHGKPWFVLPVETRPRTFASSELHAVKLVQLDTNAIPSPPGLEAVMIDQLTDPSFYRWASPGRLRLDRERLPDLTVIHLQSAPVAERLLESSQPTFPAGALQYVGMPNDGMLSRIEELADQITKPHPRGWAQIAAIRDYVRTHYQLDREVRPSADCENVPAWFLFESRRGNDYHFASATIMLLRAAGYPSRLVTGLYARDDRYDYRLRHTAILKDDVHTWVEIHAGLNWWITLEPTPGYEVLGPVPTYVERFLTAVGWVLKKVWQNVFIVVSCGIFLISLYLQRRHLLAEWKARRWRMRHHRLSREAILEAGKVISLRLNAVFWNKPNAHTLGRWLMGLSRRLKSTISKANPEQQNDATKELLEKIEKNRQALSPEFLELSRLLEHLAVMHDQAAYGAPEVFEQMSLIETQAQLEVLNQLNAKWTSWRLERVLKFVAAESNENLAQRSGLNAIPLISSTSDSDYRNEIASLRLKPHLQTKTVIA